MKHPLRVAFGLPHNYSKRLKIEAEGLERRGSPLFFHIHRVGNEFIAVALLLPTLFLPSIPEKVAKRMKNIRIIGGAVPEYVPCQVDYGIIRKFLNGFTPLPTAKEPIPKKRVYFPTKTVVI